MPGWGRLRGRGRGRVSTGGVPRALPLSTSRPGRRLPGDRVPVRGAARGPSVRASGSRAGKLTSESHRRPQRARATQGGRGRREALHMARTPWVTWSADPAARPPGPSGRHSQSSTGARPPSGWSPRSRWAQFGGSQESCCPPQPGCGDPGSLPRVTPSVSPDRPAHLGHAVPRILFRRRQQPQGESGGPGPSGTLLPPLPGSFRVPLRLACPWSP